jgi:hypothetical protein
MTLTVHVLGLRNSQKVQKERRRFDLALHKIQLKDWVLRKWQTVPKVLALMARHSFEMVNQ